MSRIEIALLGPPRVTITGSKATGFDYAKVLALLVFLAVEQGRAHSRDALAELLWPDQAASVGRASLRQALARLRQAIADQDADPPRLLVTRESVRFNPACDYSLDSRQFEELLAAADAHGHREPAACPACLGALARAVELYRGPFADAQAPRDAYGYEEWLQLRREWFARRQLDALARLADAHEARGEPDQALAYAHQALVIDPWREATHRQVMRLLAARGERTAALTQFERCRRALADELGVEPEEATGDLARQIRFGDRSDTPARLPPRPPREEAGAALPDASPTPTGAPMGAPAPLPAQPTSFVGRAAELDELRGLLARSECRLLTLFGPGGTGKTRLALRLAELVAPGYADGVYWVPLSAQSSPGELIVSLARALGVTTDDTGDPNARLREALAPRHLLLVLDNFEQLVEAAGLVGELLAAAPQLVVLVTSRERLRLRAEWVYDVAGLALPTGTAGEVAEDADAVRLLLERLRQAGYSAGGPGELAAAAQIARAVEGNPLALELAAAACRSRPLVRVAEAIAADLDALRVSLRDVPERHRSVRAAIDYSWRLLNGAQRRALARLSVFRGGFTPEAALAVAGVNEADLDDLADKSLLRRTGERVEPHELLRRFAAEQLAATGQLREARAAHLDWCVTFAESAEPQLAGTDQQDWLRRLEAEHANVRAALAWAIEEGRAEEAMRIGAALMRFWWVHGHMREGRRWLDRALALEGGSPAARARALHGAGGLAQQLGDTDAAHRLLEQSLSIERRVGRKPELVRVLTNLAFSYINQGAYEAAEELIAEALQIDRELGDERGVAFGLGILAQVAYFRADYGRAAALWAESLAGHRRAGDTHSVAVTLFNLGSARRLQGLIAEARPPLEESLATFRDLGSAYGTAFAVLQLARIAYAAGDRGEVRTLLGEGLPLLASVGVSGELAGALALVARLALDAGEVYRGARLWGAAHALLDARGVSLPPPEMHEFNLALAAARTSADEPTWAAGWEEGRALTLEEAVSEALRQRSAQPE